MTPIFSLRRKALLASAAVAATLGLPAIAAAQAADPASADPREARIEQLEAEVQSLASEVKDLKREQVEARQATTARTRVVADAGSAPAPASDAVATIAQGHPAIASDDGRFTANFHGILQFDAAAYDQASAGPIASDFRRSGPALGASASNVDLTHARDLKDGDDFRRARIGVDGRAFGDWDYKLIFDFAGSGVENTGQLYEGWVQYSGFRPLAIRIGAFAPSIGLDDQASTNSMPFLERSAVEDVARGLAAGDTRTAVALFGSGKHWLASAAVTGRVVGVLNTGTATAVPQTYGDQLGFVGRVAATPLWGDDWLVHVGLHGSYVARPADATGPGTSGVTPINAYVIALSNTPELRVDGTKLINTGNIDARHASSEGAEFAAQKGPFLLQSEYEYFDVARDDPGLASPHFDGWYVSGAWVLTGERRRYNTATAAFDGPPVNHPFDLAKGGWGAWELAVRYSDLDLNYRPGQAGTAPSSSTIRGGDETNFTAGLNWYPNSFVRFVLDYQHVRVDRLSPNAALYQTPTGAQIGQSYNAIGLRSQFAF
ncbi:MAG TPA: porin [Caulobacteraceae bacterium]|jgi:phosphate-selective porin OprO/OprP